MQDPKIAEPSDEAFKAHFFLVLLELSSREQRISNHVVSQFFNFANDQLKDIEIHENLKERALLVYRELRTEIIDRFLKRY